MGIASAESGVDSITLSMSRELGPRKIRVNAIAPGGVAAEGLARVGIIGGPIEQEVIKITPLGRFGAPEDIAKVAVVPSPRTRRRGSPVNASPSPVAGAEPCHVSAGEREPPPLPRGAAGVFV